MAKKTAITIESLATEIEEIKSRLTALEGAGGDEAAAETEDAVTIPAPDEVADLSQDDVSKLATQLGIETDGVKPKALRALIATAASIVADETEELEEDAVNALAEACGIATGKLAKTLAALKKYLDAAKDTEAESDDDDEKEEESEDEEESEESEEEESEDDEDEDEKPAKKGKAKAKADEDEEEESSDDDDDEKEEEDDEKEESEDDDESEDEAPEFTAKNLAAYNKVAKKPAKNVEALAKILTDDEGTVHAWGEAYVKGDTAYCCGLPLKDVKVTVDGEKIEGGKCIVTGKVFTQDEDGNLTEVEAD